MLEATCLLHDPKSGRGFVKVAYNNLDAIKATVDENYCDGCALCVDVCPYNAITLIERAAEADRAAGKLITVNKAQCKGCGLCQGTCPKRGVLVSGFTMKQISAQIQAALAV